MPGNEILGKEEKKHVDEVMSGHHILLRHSFQNLRGNQYKVDELERVAEQKFGVKHALAVSSGTAALRVAIAALGLPRGSIIATQSFTFVGTVEAIVEAGCVPLCLDIDETLNLAPKALQDACNKFDISAIIVVHMLGTPARMDQISEIAKSKNILVIEDTAWGIGGKFGDRFLGTIGDIGTFSFDYAKAITTGEGGMMITNNSEIDFRARAWHDHGHENNPEVARWEDTRHSSGFNYRMSELTAAVGLGQFEKFEFIFESHRANANAIWDEIKHFEFIKRRSNDDRALESLEALIFEVDNSVTALRLKQHLTKLNISTKILPEAISWHFSKTWNHIPEIITTTDLSDSEDRLRRCISLPVNIKQPTGYPQLVKKALEEFS